MAVDVPRIAQDRQFNREYEAETPPHENSINWVWPVSNWALVVFNCVIMLSVLRDVLWSGIYNPLIHFLSTSTFGLSIAILAAIHKLILRR